MALNRAARERVNDSRMKIQSVAKSLRSLSQDDIPDFKDIESCLEDAERSLRTALQASEAPSSPKPDTAI